MDSIERKTLVIMLGIIAVEGAPMVLTLGQSPPGVLTRLYGSFGQGWFAWMGAGLITLAYCAHAIRQLPVIGSRFFERHWLKVLAVPFALVSGTMEEVWFRRGIMDGAQQHGAPLLLQIVLSGLSFGIVHAMWGVFARKWRVALSSVVATSVLGTALAIVYLLGGRQLTPCIWTHAAINLVLEPWLLVAAISAGRAARPRAPVGLAPA